MTVQEDKQRYMAAAHAMQTGVATKMNWDGSETTPKHLRVGVNSAMVDSSTIARLLMAKGIFTEEEFFKTLADTMEEEVKKYKEEIQQHHGGKVEINLL